MACHFTTTASVFLPLWNAQQLIWVKFVGYRLLSRTGSPVGTFHSQPPHAPPCSTTSTKDAAAAAPAAGSCRSPQHAESGAPRTVLHSPLACWAIFVSRSYASWSWPTNCSTSPTPSPNQAGSGTARILSPDSTDQQHEKSAQRMTDNKPRFTKKLILSILAAIVVLTAIVSLVGNLLIRMVGNRSKPPRPGLAAGSSKRPTNQH